MFSPRRSYRSDRIGGRNELQVDAAVEALRTHRERTRVSLQSRKGYATFRRGDPAIVPNTKDIAASVLFPCR